MYRYQRKLFEKEAIYIAGPECFYTYGYDMLAAMRSRAESLGFGVTLPNNNPLDMENPDKQKRADSILKDLEDDMNKTTVIIADLEAFRGAEADSGTIYEIGMAYAKGAKCYGYTRDKRSLTSKNQKTQLNGNMVCDEQGKKLPYINLPFSPAIVGSTKIVEGDFDDCLKILMVDLEEEYKNQLLEKSPMKIVEEKVKENREYPLVYLAGLERYEENGRELFERMKEICKKYGFEAVSPLDEVSENEIVDSNDAYAYAMHIFNRQQQHVKDCDIVIADLNNFRGYEVSNDIGFECGMGFQLRKKLYGYMENASNLIDKIPNLGEANDYRDQIGSNVEDFNYPANLMFGSSMKIFEGTFENVIQKIAEDFNQNK